MHKQKKIFTREEWPKVSAINKTTHGLGRNKFGHDCLIKNLIKKGTFHATVVLAHIHIPLKIKIMHEKWPKPTAMNQKVTAMREIDSAMFQNKKKLIFNLSCNVFHKHSS